MTTLTIACLARSVFRRTADLLDAAAERFDTAARAKRVYTGDEQFDSDAYLAEVRNRVFTRHYY